MMKRIRRTANNIHRTAKRSSAQMLFLTGAILIPAAFCIKPFLPADASAAVFAAGSLSCIAGIIIRITNAIPARCSRHRTRARTASIPGKGKHLSKIAWWLGASALFFLIALISGEIHFLSVSALIVISGFIAIFAARIRKQSAEAVQNHPGSDTEPVIDRVKLLGSYATTRQAGLEGAWLGGLLAGGIGAVIGSLLPWGPKVRWQQFAVIYKNGRVGTEEHPVGSRRYLELMQHIDPDDF